MPIEFKCSGCGKQYKVKMELAGKRFRCKACEEPIQVPRPERRAKPKPVLADEDDDFMNALSEASEDEYEAMPIAQAPRRSKSKASPGKKKKKKRQEQGDGRGWFYKFSIGFVAVLMSLRLVAFITGGFNSARRQATQNQSSTGTPAGASGNYSATSQIHSGDWEKFTPGNKAYTILLPEYPMASSQVAGNVIEQHYVAKNKKIGVDVSHARYPVPSSMLNDSNKAQMLNDIRLDFQQTPNVTLRKETPINLGKINGKEFVFERRGTLITIRVFPAYSHMIMIQIITNVRDPQPEAISKVFNSLVIHDTSPDEEPVAELKPYLQRRKTFQTKLTEKGPAPQQYQRESPPPGVEEITYLSGQLKLKAWIDRRGAKSGNAPALLYLHGGFAFGADDLEVCKPFRDAGFVIMTPILRGENGNPGYYELFYGEVDDAAAACRWLAEQKGVDKKRIYAFGHSAGGGLSALLCLRDDVPLVHCGSAGGIYPANLVSVLGDIAPFDTSNPEESRLRVLVGNIRDMQRNHYAYTGSGDTILMAGLNEAKKEAGAESRLTTEVVPGDHFSSFAPALYKYLQQILKSP